MTPTPRPAGPGRARRLALVALLASCVACDQATKQLALARLEPGGRRSYLGDTVRLELAHNAGAFLGAGASLPHGVRTHLLTYGVGLVTLAALWLAFRRGAPRRGAVAAALVAAGGVGNLWDRLATGGFVVDFLNVGVGPLRTGIFNVADVAIVVGVLLLALPRRGAT